jgi:DNA gyrase subunit A
MKFRPGDHLLAMAVVEEGESPDVFVVFENGLAKRTPVSEYRLQGRGGLGIQVAKLSDKGGDLVGALTVSETDEVMVVMEKGKIVRSRVSEVRHTGRSTQGVRFAAPDKGDSIVAVARNAESATEAELEDAVEGVPDAGGDGAEGDATGVSDVSADGGPATVPGPDGVPSDETETDDASSEDDSGGDE